MTFTSTKVPKFAGVTSWEQYRQVFDAIVQSNGWDDATAALQLLSHLEGDALNVALLVPESQQATHGRLSGALTEHYGSPGRLGRPNVLHWMYRFLSCHRDGGRRRPRVISYDLSLCGKTMTNLGMGVSRPDQ